MLGPDSEALDKKTTTYQNRFLDLQNKVSDSAEQMEEALPLAKNFNEAHAKFLDWVLKIEPQLRAKEATGPEAFEQVQVSRFSCYFICAAKTNILFLLME